MLLALWIVGCGSDPLAAVGLAPEIVVQPPAEDEAALELPTAPPVSGADIASGGLVEAPTADGAAAPAEPAEPVKFDPISVPLGPREGAGVKWKGVTQKNERIIDFGKGEVGNPDL